MALRVIDIQLTKHIEIIIQYKNCKIPNIAYEQLSNVSITIGISLRHKHNLWCSKNFNLIPRISTMQPCERTTEHKQELKTLSAGAVHFTVPKS